jgi:DnaJ-class molecular chaperone
MKPLDKELPLTPPDRYHYGHDYSYTECDACDGAGYVDVEDDEGWHLEECEDCHGIGSVEKC